MGLMKKSKLILIPLFVIFLILSEQAAWAAASPRSIGPQQIKVKISNTESAYAIVRIIDEQLPTLILLPGIFRGFLQEEEYLKVLNRRKLNWVAWHSSRHPESIINGNQNPWLRPASTQSLAEELVVLKTTLKIQRPILVSLSYSASFIPYVNPQIFPIVIETAPMGQALENEPPSPYYESWKQWVGMFPIFGNLVVANQEYWAYRGYWAQQTDNLIKTHPRYAPFQKAVAEGLAQLAYAARTFDLRDQDFSQGPQRFWILGQKENPARKAIQREAIQMYEKQTGAENSSIVIENAGHVVPNENPEAYVKALSDLVQKITK